MTNLSLTPGRRPYQSIRIRRLQDIPPPSPRVVDVVVLDMNHEWPNLGHDSIVAAIDEIAGELDPWLEPAGMSVRILSYDVRKYRAIPQYPDERFLLYIGTGGPGHLDPRQNDGFSSASQGIREDGSWEEPLFRLFDAIVRNDEAALVGVCHTFGVLCRWAGVADAVLRTREKGGKSSGVVSNVLTREAVAHPWFSRFSEELSDGRHFYVLDNRFFDLVPKSIAFPPGNMPLAYQADRSDKPIGQALTMMEFARDGAGVVPRILASNHHPEIVGRKDQREILDHKYSRGEVSREWYEERVRSLSEIFASAESERGIRLTSRYTFLLPLRFHLYRLLRHRALKLGLDPGFHERSVLDKA